MSTAHPSRRSMLPRSAFAAFRFPPEVIVPAMRWYLRFGLSYRDVEELLPERGIEAARQQRRARTLSSTPTIGDSAGRCRGVG
jgi:hypothetical protein